jgi:hypothetical protein
MDIGLASPFLLKTTVLKWLEIHNTTVYRSCLPCFPKFVGTTNCDIIKIMDCSSFPSLLHTTKTIIRLSHDSRLSLSFAIAVSLGLPALCAGTLQTYDC